MKRNRLLLLPFQDQLPHVGVELSEYIFALTGIMSYSPDAAISFTCSSVKFSFTCHFSFLCPVLLFCQRSVHPRHTQIKNPVHDRNSKSTSVKDGIKFNSPAVPPCFTGFLYSLLLSCSLKRNYFVSFPFTAPFADIPQSSCTLIRIPTYPRQSYGCLPSQNTRIFLFFI